MNRERLPNRRRTETMTVEWRGRPVHVSVGFSHDARVLETFSRAGRPDTDIDATADDIAVLVSLLLQRGASLDEIRHSLGCLHDGTPASIAGAIVDAAAKVSIADGG